MFAIIIISLLIAIGIARFASQRFHASRQVTSRIEVPGATTARDAILMFLKSHQVTDVKIIEHQSFVTNYFDSKRRNLYFDPEILNSNSVYAWSIALHEAAHALQTGDTLKPLRWRQSNIQLSRYLPTAVGFLCVLLVFLKRVPSRTALISFSLILALLMLAVLMSSPIEKNASKIAFLWLEKRFAGKETLLEAFKLALVGAAWRDSATILRSPKYCFMAFLPMAAKPRPF